MLALLISNIDETPSSQINAFVYDGCRSVQRESFPGLLWVLHVESVNIEVKIIKATDLKHKATVNDNQSRMQFANWDIWQSRPRLFEEVKAIAVSVTDGH